ncbi:MAG: molybdopterin molybdotransferase MoeA [Candidatus Puniceispirillaceae bacterium]
MMSAASSPPARMIPIDAARKMLADRITPLTGDETVLLDASLGRVAATDIISTIDLPRTQNAAVDGYGVSAKILAGDPSKAFKIVGAARAGHPYAGVIGDDEAIEIYTGAIMPGGPDCVAMHEDCNRNGQFVVIQKPLKAGSNMRPPGENLAKGEAVITKGQRITAALIGQLAAAGHDRIAVQKTVKVGLLSTGDEIVEAGSKLEIGQVYDSNRPMMRALLADSMFSLSDRGIVPDKLAALTSAYEQALDSHDVVISSGGASDGIEDHTQAAMQAVGADCAFWRLAMKPGRPMAVGQKGKKLIFCLPGNPVAAFVCTKLLIMPLLTHLAGGVMTMPLKFSVPAGFSHKKAAGRAEYLRATIADSIAGQEIKLHGRKGAGVISSLTGADGLVEIPLENAGVEPGMPLAFLPFADRAL